MATDLMALFERIWHADPEAQRELAALPRGVYRVDVTPETAVFVPRGFGVCSNVAVFRTRAGLLMVDTGNPNAAQALFEAVRAWDVAPLRIALYTHGHGDHVHGTGPFDEEAREQGWAGPRVLAHEALPRRFDRYRETAGYNAIINQRQFGARNVLPAGASTERHFRYPDETYDESLTLELGGEPFELYHGRGETDDHTWVWAPQRRIVCTGDFFISVFPNAGNPQKVQRYPLEWAAALRRMVEKQPELLIPGHGAVISGAERVRQALEDTAEVLEGLHHETVRLMNEGATLDEIIHTVRVPERYLRRPYLHVTYDDPEFIVRNVWRLLGGWYDGNPAHLKPAPDGELATEVAALAGGVAALIARARALAAAGELRLAGHLAQLAVQAAPDDREARRAHAEVYEQRAAAEPTLMAKGIFGAAARESREHLGAP
jgi:alkyl sulfatase BDS1-like metallo-beta-lactamase superfamily hydrolase